MAEQDRPSPETLEQQLEGLYKRVEIAVFDSGEAFAQSPTAFVGEEVLPDGDRVSIYSDEQPYYVLPEQISGARVLEDMPTVALGLNITKDSVISIGYARQCYVRDPENDTLLYQPGNASFTIEEPAHVADETTDTESGTVGHRMYQINVDYSGETPFITGSRSVVTEDPVVDTGRPSREDLEFDSLTAILDDEPLTLDSMHRVLGEVDKRPPEISPQDVADLTAVLSLYGR